jgi:hypothetical protein
MEKLGAFVPKSHLRGFVMKELLQLSFDPAPQVDFWVEKSSDIF